MRAHRRPSAQEHFTIGINDDVTHTSLDYDPAYSAEIPGTVRALFFAWAPMDGGRQQELHQDHRRRDRKLRAGLLRVRLQEVRRHHHLPLALRSPPAAFQLT